MKIYVHYETVNEPWGGINSFFKAFKYEIKNWSYRNRADKSKIEIVDNPKYCDIFLMGANSCGKNKRINAEQIKSFKTQNPSMKIVHRIDGAKSVYTRDNKHLASDMMIYNLSKFADGVVFQSNDSLECFSKLGYSGKNHFVIHNGVNQKIFNLGKEKEFWKVTNKLKILAVSWSDNVNKGFDLIPALSTFSDVDVTFVGQWPAEIERENVKVFEAVKQEKLASYYRNAHVFFHGARNDPCPNVVLEALSCGCPVIYHPSGGTEEIAYKYGISLAKINTEDILRIAVNSMKNCYPAFTNRLMMDMNNFSIKNTILKYLNIFRNL